MQGESEKVSWEREREVIGERDARGRKRSSPCGSLMMEVISVARRHEEREGEKKNKKKRRKRGRRATAMISVTQGRENRGEEI